MDTLIDVTSVREGRGEITGNHDTPSGSPSPRWSTAVSAVDVSPGRPNRPHTERANESMRYGVTNRTHACSLV